MARFALRRAVSGIAVLILIAYLSFLSQNLALLRRSNQPAPLGQVAQQAFSDSVQMLRGLPKGRLGSYAYSPSQWGERRLALMRDMLSILLTRSLALLASAMIVGGLVGGLIGTLAAAKRRADISLGLMLLSIVGISTPSFFLGMLLQFLEISFYRRTGIRLVPVGGFGWDRHIILPVLVLAARPVAQVARLTHARVTNILDADYVRAARAKGLKPLRIWAGHILPNAANSVLTAMGTSLRFSLSSLPVVEFLFGWPGAGKAMLDMLQVYQREGATALVLFMGMVFVLVNILLDLACRAIDPRLRQDQSQLRVGMDLREWVGSILAGLWSSLMLQRWRERRRDRAGDRLSSLTKGHRPDATSSLTRGEDAARRKARWRKWIQAVSGNPGLVLGVLLCGGLAVLVVSGPSLTRHNPHSISSFLVVDGKQVPPPVAPSATYPLGTDTHGRDISSLLLAGARRTLSMALFAAAARILVGGMLGFLAGWFAGSRLDRAIMGVAEALSAFPSLLLAMLIVYAVGVRHGLTAFVAALTAIGWGEVMQTVRARVMGIKPMQYVESAVATGLSQGQILGAHVLPNVWPTIISLAFLEMGGALMILGELGFLGVFIGGGLAAEGDDLPRIVYYDVPEWSVMLANSWRAFRSYPWATLYPALAFFLAILGFTFLGHGIRRLTERLTLSFRSLFNRYTLALGVTACIGVALMFESTGFYAANARIAGDFEASRAMVDIGQLASETYNGRLSGTPDAERVAEWIATQFEELGLLPAGDTVHSYYQAIGESYRDLVGMPALVLRGPGGKVIRAVYGLDFVRQPGTHDIGGSGAGDVVLVTEAYRYAVSREGAAAMYGMSLAEFGRQDRILLRLTEARPAWSVVMGRSGVLSLDTGPLSGYRHELLARSTQPVGESVPVVLVSSELVGQLLAHGGHDLDDLRESIESDEREPVCLPTGWTAELDIPVELRTAVEVHNVIGFWPGTHIDMDNEAIVVAAYYDGLGRLPDGTLYPGANDNASGVATMLEVIRTLKRGDFQPKRTIIFAAWIGGERHQAVEYSRFLRARLGFSEAYQIVAGLELDGVGAGTGSSIAVLHPTRERLTEMIQRAARKVGAPLSTHETGLHADPDLWPSPEASLASATLSWAGSDALAHTPEDTLDNIDPEKIAHVGRTTSLALMVLSSDPAY